MSRAVDSFYLAFFVTGLPELRSFGRPHAVGAQLGGDRRELRHRRLQGTSFLRVRRKVLPRRERPPATHQVKTHDRGRPEPATTQGPGHQPGQQQAAQQQSAAASEAGQERGGKHFGDFGRNCRAIYRRGSRGSGSSDVTGFHPPLAGSCRGPRSPQVSESLFIFYLAVTQQTVF